MQSLTVEQYVARQPRYGWRRAILRGLIRIIGFTFLCRVQISGRENIPDDGPCILMMNHISALDPIICMGAIRNRYVIPMTKIENTYNPLLRFFVWWWGSYTVDRTTLDRRALKSSIELVKSGQMILIAPEGTRQPEGLGEAKRGMAYVAVKSDAIVVPATLSDVQDYKSRWKRLRPARARVTFGRPFRLKTGGRTRIPRPELDQMTRESMYQLALTQPDDDLRGVYSDVENATTATLDFV